MKLTCSVCKFTLAPTTEAEITAYTAKRPLHCAMPMVVDGEKKEEPKEEKKGFFGLGKSKKKK